MPNIRMSVFCGIPSACDRRKPKHAHMSSVYPNSAMVSAVRPSPSRSSYVTPIRVRVSCGQCMPTRSARSALKSLIGCASHGRIRGQSASTARPDRTHACRSGCSTYRFCSDTLNPSSLLKTSLSSTITSPHVRVWRARSHPCTDTACPGVRWIRMRVRRAVGRGLYLHTLVNTGFLIMAWPGL